MKSLLFTTICIAAIGASCVQSAHAQDVRPLTISQFEKSVLFQKYKLISKDHWSLRAGGINFWYSFPDPDNPDNQNASVEMSSEPADIRTLAISWIGESTSNPASLTRRRELFLREVLQATYPDIDSTAIAAFVRAEQRKRYPGGGNAMPRKRLASASVHAGTVGSRLIVGIERTAGGVGR